MDLRLGFRSRRSCVQSSPLLERVTITMTVVFIKKLLKIYLEHRFLVKWSGCEVEGLLSSGQAKEKCPQKLIEFYQSRLKFLDTDEFILDLNTKKAREIFCGHMETGQPLFLLFSSAEADDHDVKLAIMLWQAKKNKDKMLFVTVNTDINHNKMILEFFGIADGELPTFRAMKDKVQIKPEDDSFTPENVKKFVTAFREGKLVQRSEKIVAKILGEILNSMDITGEDSEVKLWKNNNI